MAILVACSKGDDSLSGVGYGSITILSEVESSALLSDVDVDYYEIPSDVLPNVDDLQLHIVGSYIDPTDRTLQSYDETFENATIFNSSASIMWSGEYEAALNNGGDITVESTTNACFMSEYTPFIIVKGEYNTELSLTAKLINSIIRLKCGDWFKSYFSAAEFTVTTQSGNKFTFDPFSEDNDDRIIFVAADSKLTLSGEATRASSGNSVTFAATEVATTVSSQMTTLMVETEDVGEAKVTITINSNIIQVEEQNFELNPLTE